LNLGRKFDTDLIIKFNKNDYKKTKICRDTLKTVMKCLDEENIDKFDFEWI